MNSAATEINLGTLAVDKFGLSSPAKWLILCFKTPPLLPPYLFKFRIATTAIASGRRIPMPTRRHRMRGPVPSWPNIHCGSATPSLTGCLPSGCPYLSKFSRAISFVNALYAGVIESVKKRCASGSGFLSGWYCSESLRYAFLIVVASAPSGTLKMLYGSKTVVSGPCVRAIWTTSRAERVQPITSTRLKPLRSARSLRPTDGLARTARAAWALPQSDVVSVGMVVAIDTIFDLSSISLRNRSACQLPTRPIVIGTRKNWKRDRRNMGNRFPWLSVGSPIFYVDGDVFIFLPILTTQSKCRPVPLVSWTSLWPWSVHFSD